MTTSTLERGSTVALTLTPDTAPFRVWVGEVAAVDEHGVRLSISPDLGLFVPWGQVVSALVAEDVDQASFERRADHLRRSMGDPDPDDLMPEESLRER